MLSDLDKKFYRYEIAFCKNFKKIREKYNVSHYEMAGIFDLRVRDVEQIEEFNIPADIDISLIFNIARIFGVPPGSLFEIDDD